MDETDPADTKSPSIFPTWPGHPISYTTTRIELLVGENLLATGTGFVIRYAQRYALVSNWHVFAGRSPIDGTCISKTGGFPDRARFHVALIQELDLERDGYSEKLYLKPIEIDLYRDPDMTEPVWFDNRDADTINDYALLPLDPYVPELRQDDHSLRHILAGRVAFASGHDGSPVPDTDVEYLYPSVGRQVFIIGYPAGINHSGVFPIWKGGTIASEPAIFVYLGDVRTEDAFFVDGLTRAGMSGAPVVCLVEEGEILNASGKYPVEMDRPRSLLLGVYAGREGVTKNEADLALGRVWKVEAIERLFRKVISTQSA